MNKDTIGVGIIGAGDGWAKAAHLPALAALPGVRVVAVSTTRQESADATARQFGVPHAFDNAAALLALPEVDVVVVSVRAPRHAALVRQVVAAGKHVLCEWPVGASVAETTELAALARARGVTRSRASSGASRPRSGSSASSWRTVTSGSCAPCTSTSRSPSSASGARRRGASRRMSRTHRMRSTR